ncbi:MAG: tetratricopeptide repeat protein [Polyangiaceae bacterium]|nr:tetratricopeptide repeat protein [Polyangiaceae bacterium]
MDRQPDSLRLRAELVGRTQELAALREAYQRVSKDGAFQGVTILGNAGLGKSRLIEEFLGDLAKTEPAQLRVFSGRARSQVLGYGMFGRLLRDRFEIGEGMEPEEIRSRIRSRVAEVLEDRKVGDVCFFLAQLMGLEFEDSPLTRAIADDPAQARFLRRAVVRSFLEKDAQLSPICLVFEDVHHTDDDSAELLLYLLENLHAKVLVVCTSRPELITRYPNWFHYGEFRHQRLELTPLSQPESVELISQLLRPCADGPPDALIEASVGVAGGNPGLLRGMVHIFHDSGVLQRAPEEGSGWVVNLDKLASVRMPLTVDDAVALRVSAMSPLDRRVLEHAAAMGGVFWLGGLVTLERMERETPNFWDPEERTDTVAISAALDDLVRRDYVLKLQDSAFTGDIEYVFKHNLERQKIANLTSASASQKYHQTIADWLAQKPQVKTQESYCAMLAQHLEQSGSFTRAGLAYLDAGDLARSHYAAKKADEYFSKGLSLLGADDCLRRMNGLHNHGDVLLVLGKTDEALAAFREMLKLAYQFALFAKGGAAHNRIGRLCRDAGALGEARQHLDAGLKLFESADDKRGIASSHDDIGMLLWVRGDYSAALKHLKTALDMRKEIGDRRSIALSLNNIGLVWMEHGEARKASEALEAALQIRREVADPLGVVESLNNLGRLAHDQADHERALVLFNQAYQAAQDIGEHNRIAGVLTRIGETHQRLGNTTEALRFLTQAEELCDELGDRLHLAEAKRGLAKTYLKQKELLKARQAIKHAVDLFGQVRSKVRLAAALRTLGEVTGAGAWGEGHEAKAVDYFMRSIAIAKEIGNELEVAKSYTAFVQYVTNSPHYQRNDAILREASKLKGMASEIFERHSNKREPAVAQ